MTRRALLTVAAPSAVMLALLASGTLAFSPISRMPLAASVPGTPLATSFPASQDLDTALRVFASAWRARDYIGARAAARQLKDPTLSVRLEQLVVFGEARAAIERNDIAQASRLASHLESGAKRALIFAAMSVQVRDRSATRWLNIALSDVARLPQSQKRALLSLLLPVVLNVDARRGLRLLDEAIHDDARQVELRSPLGVPTKHGTGGAGHGSILFETVRGSASKQIFVLTAPGLRASHLRDLALSHHAGLRCHFDSRHDLVTESQVARHRSPSD